jgi:ATP synthase protein I
MTGNGSSGQTPPEDRGDRGDKEPRSGGSSDAWAIVSYILSGLLAWGGIGWLLDRWLGTTVFVVVGVLVGFAGAFYLIIRRFGGL